jgi:ADP-ribose pyrophosphatase
MTGLPQPREGWSVLEREVLCETPYLCVQREVLSSPLRPAGRPWLVVERKPAVVIVPLFDNGNFLLVKQERPPVRRLLLEFPAGQIDGPVSPEIMEQTARRELLEETGFAAHGPLQRLGTFFSSPGFTNECQTVFLARVRDEAGPDAARKPDPTEAIAGFVRLSHDAMRRAIAEGMICDANTLAGFSLLSASSAPD